MLMHQSLLAHGYIGVDLFFGLSGFLITSLLLDEWDRIGSISLRRFYERRIRRLGPALLLLVGLFLAIDAALHPFVGLPAGVRALTTLAFVNDWVAGLGQQGLGALNPTWSLALEEQFYLVWPALLVVLLRRRLRPAALLGCLAVAIIALVGTVPLIERAVSGYSLYYSPLDRAAELLIGCAGAIVWRERLTTRIAASPLAGLAAAAALVLLLRPGNEPPLWIYMPAIVASVALIVCLLEREHGLLARIVACPPLRFVGRISYGLYLFNLVVRNLLVDYLPGHTPLFYAPVGFALTFLVAAASWRLLEAPILARATPTREHSEPHAGPSGRTRRGRLRLAPAR